MADPTAKFFDDLRRRAHAPELGRFVGTMRFDLSDEGRVYHWRLSINDGDIAVSRDADAADCVISGDRALFDQLASGRVTPLTAWLSNKVAVKGSFRPLLLLERLLPEPPGVHDPRDPGKSSGPRS
jgi:hypothetical protein